MKRILYTLAFFVLAFALNGVLAAANDNYDFEPQGWTTGSVNTQNNWKCTGPYDVEVVANPRPELGAFGSQSLRISNAVASGAFGDQTFSAPLVDDAGETNALPTSPNPGSRQSRFEAQFDLASYTGVLQSGLKLSVSPDNGSGARMSYLRFEDKTDGTDGIHVIFAEVTGVPAAFREYDIATVDRAAAHTFKFVIYFVDGPSNDVVRIYVDGTLKHVGTSWENYYRNDPGSLDVYPTRAVNCLLFRVAGDPVLENGGKGFLIDNVSLASGPGFSFNGFFPPVNNTTVNQAKAGTAIPVKFSVGGNKGLNIFEEQYPTVVDCNSSSAQPAVGNSLSYDPVTDQYTYVWKTDKSWKNMCKRLVLQFQDGTQHSADFQFK